MPSPAPAAALAQTAPAQTVAFVTLCLWNQEERKMVADEGSADEQRGGRGGEAAQRRQRQAVGQQRILKRRHGKRPDRVDNLRKTTANVSGR